MCFQLKTFMPYAILGAFLVLLALTSPPHIYNDKTFLSGKNIKRELLTVRSYIGESGNSHPSAGAELSAHLALVEGEVDALLNHSRWRQLWGSGLFIASAGVVVMLAGLFVTVLVSWKADVGLLQTKLQTGESSPRE